MKAFEAAVQASWQKSGVKLADSGKDAFLREALRRRVDVPPNWIAATPDDLALFWPTPQPAGQLTKTDVEKLFVDGTVRTVWQDVPGIIASTSKNAGITTTPDAYKSIQSDLQTRSQLLAKSGFDAAKIKAYNSAYRQTVLGAAGGSGEGVLTYQKYVEARVAMFRPVVRLTISSIPDGATVDIAGLRVGKTKLEKPLESGKTYNVVFNLQGYKSSTRSYYVLPDQPEQTLTEPMLPLPPP